MVVCICEVTFSGNYPFLLIPDAVLCIEVKIDQTNKESKTVAPLKEGQIWSLKDKVLEVKRVGKYLVEFLITPKENIPAPQEKIRNGKHLESIQAVERFLQNHKAILEGAGS